MLGKHVEIECGQYHSVGRYHVKRGGGRVGGVVNILDTGGRLAHKPHAESLASTTQYRIYPTYRDSGDTWRYYI